MNNFKRLSVYNLIGLPITGGLYYLLSKDTTNAAPWAIFIYSYFFFTALLVYVLASSQTKRIILTILTGILEGFNVLVCLFAVLAAPFAASGGPIDDSGGSKSKAISALLLAICAGINVALFAYVTTKANKRQQYGMGSKSE